MRVEGKMRGLVMLRSGHLQRGTIFSRLTFHQFRKQRKINDLAAILIAQESLHHHD